MLVLAIITLVLTMTGMGSCNFLVVEGLTWGFLWREQTPEEAAATNRLPHCIRWTEQEKDLFDATWKAATAFAYLSIIVVIISTGTALSLSCTTVDRMYARLLGSLFLALAVFQGLAYISLSSQICTEYDCVLSFGSGITIFAIVVAALTAFYLFMLQPFNETRAAPIAQPKTDDSATHEDETAQSLVIQPSSEMLAIAEPKTDESATHEDDHAKEEEASNFEPTGEPADLEAGSDDAVAEGLEEDDVAEGFDDDDMMDDVPLGTKAEQPGRI